jgi:cytochrome oxidase Cu insertion factor (SCO1/SenC/PrrC family)
MRRKGLDLRLLLSLFALVIIAGAIALLTVGGSSAQKANNAQAKQARLDAEAVLSPPTPAPPLALRNSLGQPVNIDSYRGKAVLVTFLYTNCPDICPLITSNLRVAQNLMGPATSSKVQIIAVSVDPRGDTPKAVAAFLARHEMTGRMQYLVGSAVQLGGGFRTRRAAAAVRQPLRPDLRDHRLRQAAGALRRQLQARGSSTRRASAGRSLIAARWSDARFSPSLRPWRWLP